MNFPHLYIKSILEEVKNCNQKMLDLSIQTNGFEFSNFHPSMIYKNKHKIEELSLYIEQLNQEVVQIINEIGEKK